MKTRRLLTLTFLSVFFVNANLFAQWTEIPYVSGTYIYDNLEYYQGATYTSFNFKEQLLLFKTEDNIHWHIATELPGIVPSGLSKFVLGGGNMYLFGYNLSLQKTIAYRSSDGGNQWIPLQLPAQDLFLIAAQDSSIICASKTDVFHSANNGDSWNHVLELPEIAYDLKPIASNEWLITTAGPLFHSVGGTAWDSLPAPYDANGINFPELTIYPIANAIFIEFSEEVVSKLFRSTDNLTTWECFDIPLNSSSSNLWDIESIGEDLYAVVNGRIALSKDNGATWDYILSPQGTIQLATNGDTLLAGGSYGFFKSYDLADKWRSGNQGWKEFGLPITDYISSERLYRHKENFHLSTSDGHYFTDNDGIEWQLVDENRNLVYGAESGDSLVFLGGGVLRTLDSGNDWEFFINDTLTVSHKFAQVGSSLFSYWLLETGFLRSDDWGKTWDTHWTNALNPEGMASDGSKLYIIDNGGVLVSNNNGLSFSPLNNGLGNPLNVKKI